MSGPPATGSKTPASPAEQPRPVRWKRTAATAAAVVCAVALALAVAGIAGTLTLARLADTFEPEGPPELPPGPDRAAGSVDTVSPTGAGPADGGGQADSQRSPEQNPAGAEPSPQWLNTVSEATGLQRRALEGYARAQLTLMDERPECLVSWPTLAGIGEVESAHGTIDGGRIGADGRTTEDIIGIPLDGTNNTAAIRDTDDGELDGDTRWDRAVGPMQFIPTTWDRWGADADASGGADPHNVDDAALAAARYLCSEDRVLTSDSGWWEAILEYNESRSYGEDVLGAADGYATAAAGAV